MLIFSRTLFFTLITLMGTVAQGETPVTGSNLSKLEIKERGEIQLEGDKISYREWSSTSNPGKVHILQYVAGTRAASAAYSAFTDKLIEVYPVTDYHVTTIINLDDAMWGTGGLVTSEVESSKRDFPHSTMVLDKNGTGRDGWKLQKKGAALAIMDKQGTVLYFTQQPMQDGDLETLMELVKSQIES